jgi:hypothetical protein
MPIEQLRIKKILPRHREIMRRLILGMSQTDIARDLGMSQTHINIICNSPLFKLELGKEQSKRSDQISRIQDSLYDGAEKAIVLHNKIVDNDELPLSIRQKSATDIASIAIRSLSKLTRNDSRAEATVPYEQRLKEVIYREVSTSASPPPGASLDADVREAPPLLPPGSDEIEDIDWDEEGPDNGDGDGEIGEPESEIEGRSAASQEN